MERAYRHGGEVLRVAAERQGSRLQIETADGRRTFEWQELAPGDYLLRDNGKQTRCVVARDGEDRWVWVAGCMHHLKVESGAKRRREDTAAGSLTSPMPGLVLQVLVAAGDKVARNQPLVVLEAMKMQYEITAPRDGTVAKVHVEQGQQVQGDVVLVELQEASE